MLQWLIWAACLFNSCAKSGESFIQFGSKSVTLLRASDQEHSSRESVAKAVPGDMAMQMSILECPKELTAFENAQSCEPVMAESPLEMLREAYACKQVLIQALGYSSRKPTSAETKRVAIDGTAICEILVSVMGPYNGVRFRSNHSFDLETVLLGDFRGLRLSHMILGGLNQTAFVHSPRNVIVTIDQYNATADELHQSSHFYNLLKNSQSTWATCVGNIDDGLYMSLDHELDIRFETSIVTVQLPKKGAGGSTTAGLDLSASWTRPIVGISILV